MRLPRAEAARSEPSGKSFLYQVGSNATSALIVWGALNWFRVLTICRRRRLGLDELFQVRLAAAHQHRLPDMIAQPNDSLKIGACGQDRIADLHADRAATRKPLAAAQQRPCALDNARQDGKVRVGRDLECP